MGRGYLIEHCISALNQDAKEWAYREYMSECSRITGYNTAVIASAMTRGEGDVMYIGKSYRDIIREADNPPEERSAEEIIGSFLDHFGRKEESE